MVVQFNKMDITLVVVSQDRHDDWCHWTQIRLVVCCHRTDKRPVVWCHRTDMMFVWCHRTDMLVVWCHRTDMMLLCGVTGQT